MRRWLVTGTALSLIVGSPADAQRVAKRPPLQRQLDRAMTLIEEQRSRLDAQATEIAALRRRLEANAQVAQPIAPEGPPQPGVAAAQGAAPGASGDPGGVQQAPLQRVGQAPADEDRPIELAVLDSQGSVVTRRGQLTGEIQLDYARADRNRAVARGEQIAEVILIGFFDINESRQDVFTDSFALRYGVTNRLELGARLPLVHRSDTTIVTPIRASATQPLDQIPNSISGGGVGDLELTARYQLIDGGNGSPYVIGNLQGVFPTGTSPFSVPRDSAGRARKIATGAGFYGVSPSVTAILPSDPVVLFGTVGYTFNLGRRVNTIIEPVMVNYVDPGDAISASAGIGISFNQRTTLNLGYAHSWAFGTKTRTRLRMPTSAWGGENETSSRDLQIGRLLFGVTYRATERASVNWSVEVGSTEDATDLRTVLRIPVVLLTGR